MTFSFPPDPRPAWLLVAVQLALAVMSLGSVVLLVLRTCRPPGSRDGWMWFGMILVSLFLANLLIVNQHASQSAIGMALFVTAVSSAAILITSARLFLQSASTDSTAAIGFPVALFVLVVWALLLPTGGHSGEPSFRTQCRNNLKTIGIAFHNFHDEDGAFPSAVINARAPRSWRVELLPWIDQEPLRTRYNDDAEWNAAQNEPLTFMPPREYVCPSNFNPMDERNRRYTAYAAVTGDGSTLLADRRNSISQIADGTSNTLMVIEACGQEIVWTEPRDVDATKAPIGINLNGSSKTRSPGLGSSYHVGGCQVLTGDGAVRFMSQSIDPTLLKSLTTAAGGENVDGFWDYE
jgi:hypothetical protein